MSVEYGTPFLSFVKIIVADADRVYDFYNKVLGVEQRMRVQYGEGHEALDEIVSKPVGGGNAPTMAIKCFVNRPAPVPGELQIGFVVDSVDETVAKALAAGGSVIKAAYDHVEFGVRVAFFGDVEGHTVEIIERLATSPANT